MMMITSPSITLYNYMTNILVSNGQCMGKHQYNVYGFHGLVAASSTYAYGIAMTIYIPTEQMSPYLYMNSAVRTSFYII